MDKLAKQVSLWIDARAQNDWPSMIDDDEIIPDEDALIQEAVADLLEWMADEIRLHPIVQQAIKEARIIVREAAEDSEAYYRNPLAYYGMSQKDFI